MPQVFQINGVMSQVLTNQVPSPSASGTARPSGSAWPLVGIVLAGAAVRLALLLWFQGEPLYIWDERDYNHLARNLVRHGQFAYTWQEPAAGGGAGALAGTGTVPTLVPTSLRPPLYPAFVAAVYSAFGMENFQAVRAAQLVLSLLTVVVAYALGREAYDRRVGLVAAALCCFYPSLLAYSNLLLTEVLFTFLLCAACLCVVRGLRRDSVAWLVLAGAVIGLAALTRSVLWLFPPVLAVMILLGGKAPIGRRALAAAGMVAAFAVVIAPWAVRNSRLQRSFVTIDVMSGRNFMMGNYEHTPLFRSWDAISMTRGESWDGVLRAANPSLGQMTQGAIDKLAFRHGLAFVRENPGLTAKRDAVKLIQFWGLERELVAGARQGYWGQRPPRAVLPLALVVFGGYVLAMLSGATGMIMAPPPDRRVHLFLLLVIAFVCGLHVLAFAHSRYRLPLMPLVLVYSAAAIVHLWEISQRRSAGRFRLAASVCGLFVLAWGFEIMVIEPDRVRAVVGAG